MKLRVATKTSLQLISAGTGVTRRPIDVWVGAKPKPDGDDPGDQGRMMTITQIKEIQPGGSVFLVKLLKVRDRTAAEALIGSSIFAPEDRRAPLADDEYFAGDLIGLDVIGVESGQSYGKITAVLSQPANDVYETDQGALIPAVKAFVNKIDIPASQVWVVDVPGLRPSEADELRSDGEE